MNESLTKRRQWSGLAAVARLGITGQFFLTIAVSSVALVLILHSLVSTSVASYVMKRNSDSVALYMRSFLEPNLQGLAAGGALSQADSEALTALTLDPALGDHVLSIKVWAPDGTVVFATDQDLVGKTFAGDELDKPLTGETVAYLDDLESEENVNERDFGVPVFEIYVPLRDGDGRIIAVGEFYEDATKLAAYLSYSARQNWLVLTAGSLAIIAILYAVFRQGTTTIARQRAEIKALRADQLALAEQNAATQDEVETARRELVEIDRMVRRRVGLELHDGPSQLLAYLMLALDDIGRVRPRAGLPDTSLDEVRATAERAMREVRALSQRLVAAEGWEPGKDAPTRLETVVLAYELRAHTNVARQGFALCDALPPVKRAGLAAIANESLHNGFKHANGAAQSVRVWLEPNTLVLEVGDEGPGLPDAGTLAARAQEGHLGLAGMREQATAIGARLEIESAPGGPTIVRVTLPLENL